MRIRPSVPGDAHSLAQFIVDYGVEDDRQLNVSCVAREIEALFVVCAGATDHVVFLAEDKGHLVGYAAIHWIPFPLFRGTEGYISELFVASAKRGCGIGSQLLDRVEAAAQERGCFRLMLNNVRDAVSYKREFYEKRGFMERHGVGNFVKEIGNE